MNHCIAFYLVILAVESPLLSDKTSTADQVWTHLQYSCDSVCVHDDIYALKREIITTMVFILFLFVAHFLRADYGHDLSLKTNALEKSA